ncbi:MAG: hypothetical protein E6J91_40315 [Deltaproteobacteria bacterium]|nr:MAG: hypothetical protein E6J91_40315 [Deltaproteobacteria bacterium]
MRGLIGLVIGVVLGAGAMYLVLRWPWARPVASQPPGAPPVVVVAGDAGVPRPKKKRRSRPPGVAGQPAAAPGEAEVEEPAPPPLTAAERALEWRGDDVALPPQTIDMAGGQARPLDDGEINQAINSQAGGVRDCVVAGATGTDLSATIVVKLLVDGRGRVTRSRIQAPRYLFEHGLLGCTQRALGRIHFPATGGATIVTLPINLG